MRGIQHIITTVIFLCSTSVAAFAENIDSTDKQGSRPLSEIANEISQLMREHHYDPSVLKQKAYDQMEDKAAQIAENADSVKAFVDGFNKLWGTGPFSHVHLDFAKMNAYALANYLDAMEVGGSGCQLTWDGDIAILTVNTMMGLDTIRQIQEAYQSIIDRQAKALVIDLRQNHGGAFAVKPLVAHLLKEPLDAGAFVSQKWTAEHPEAPTRSTLESMQPWDGWSIKSFWNDVVSEGVLRIQLQPATEIYEGPVCVLISKFTASAAELAADAMGQLENVVIIGETSAGQMLSQTMFDLADGLQLSLPIADYFSSANQRIEGAGVSPDLNITAEKAMEAAMRWIQTQDAAIVPKNEAL